LEYLLVFGQNNLLSKNKQFFFYFDQGASYKFLPENIFLDFRKDKFTVRILCFISLLILCLEVVLIKRLLWLLNELAAPFKKQQKNSKNVKKWP